jgi:hypothetical protein
MHVGRSKLDDKSKFFELLAVAVASGASIRSSAGEIGCSESHAYHLSSTPEFRQRVFDIRSEITSQSVGRLTHAASQAAATLVSLLDASQEPNVRLNASKAILANLGPMAELGELRARIDALEKAKAVG